ncbi:hypothetical protein [Paludibacterium denitrificans]|uniref:Uncharacterized protein n=1 Tax=Paludibacterium denitrificans TaxID=2675226 RepID=A0A844GB21_9NEIS|nr:hypothetical protein [Paludibacterium denitrificans]MTD33623.1 hypothetical protein [Paludibacterium denitrificans]
MASISTQKPTLSLACGINYLFREVYFCWKSDQLNAPETHDLWLPLMGTQIVDDVWLNDANGDQSDAPEEERYSWTDVLVICQGRIVAGGFWTSTSDSLVMQVESSQSINFRPLRYWSEEVLAGARERAAYLDSVTPWYDRECINEMGRRYRTLLSLTRDL